MAAAKRVVLDAKARPAKEIERARGPRPERKPLTATIGERCIARQLARLADRESASEDMG